ncbi:MAG TPA: hypothetical protein PKA63_09005 [Oligoflexia bacterium]|nr:hypothetical protein [Oligoflexia bacterium]HMP48790.1 hypothetical protein [Oligoflexia bacterium]
MPMYTRMKHHRQTILMVSLLCSILLLLFIAVPRQTSEGGIGLSGLSFSAFGTWNGYNDHLLVLECLNQKNQQASLSLSIRGQGNESLGEEDLNIPPLGVSHAIFNKFDIKNRYGTFEIKPRNGVAEESISCNMVTYRMNGDSTLQYATSSPLNSTLSGKSSGVYNSMNPDPNISNPVYNWLSISNPGDLPFNAVINVKDQGGLSIGEPILVSNIPSGGRQDYALGHHIGQVVGTYEIVPLNPFVPYGAFLSRYSEVSPGNFNYSILIPASRGKTDSGMIAASSMGPAWNWAEIANISSETIQAELEVFSRSGESLVKKAIMLPPYAQHHEFLNTYIGDLNVGFFRVKSSKAVIAQSFYYGFDPGNNTSTLWAYNSMGTEGFYRETSISLNTYLNTPNWLKVFSEDSDPSTILMSIYDQSGNKLSLANNGLITLAGSVDVPIHEMIGPDFIGWMHLKTASEKSFQAEVIRVYMDQDDLQGRSAMSARSMRDVSRSTSSQSPTISTMLSLVPPPYHMSSLHGGGSDDDTDNTNPDDGNDTGGNSGNTGQNGTREDAILSCMQEYGFSKAECEGYFSEYCESNAGANDERCKEENSSNDDSDLDDRILDFEIIDSVYRDNEGIKISPISLQRVFFHKKNELGGPGKTTLDPKNAEFITFMFACMEFMQDSACGAFHMNSLELSVRDQSSNSLFSTSGLIPDLYPPPANVDERVISEIILKLLSDPESLSLAELNLLEFANDLGRFSFTFPLAATKPSLGLELLIELSSKANEMDTQGSMGSLSSGSEGGNFTARGGFTGGSSSTGNSGCTRDSCPSGQVCTHSGNCRDGECMRGSDCPSGRCHSYRCSECEDNFPDRGCEDGKVCHNGTCIDDDCVYSNSCPCDQVCIDKKCVDATDGKCNGFPKCQNEPSPCADGEVCKTDECIPENFCEGNFHCPKYHCCKNETCVPCGCSDNTDCQSGTYCDKGTDECKPGCRWDSDCPHCHSCKNNQCEIQDIPGVIEGCPPGCDTVGGTCFLADGSHGTCCSKTDENGNEYKECSTDGCGEPLCPDGRPKCKGECCEEGIACSGVIGEGCLIPTPTPTPTPSPDPDTGSCTDEEFEQHCPNGWPCLRCREEAVQD